MGRQLISILPTSREKLMPQTPNITEVKANITLSKKKAKHYYDKSAKPLKTLKEGESVRVQFKGQNWEPAVIIKRHNERSYSVRTNDGIIYRRNRRQLIQTNDSHPLQCNIKAPVSQNENTLCTSKKFPTNASMSISQSMESLCSNQSTPDPDARIPQDCQQSGYRTRSGRIVKTKIIESM